MAPESLTFKDNNNMDNKAILEDDGARLMRERRISHIMSCLAIAAALAACVIPGVQAWSNGGYSADPSDPDYGTHDWIADMALTIQVRDVTFLSTTYHSRYLLGTEAPDNPDYIGDSTNHHVYYFSSGAVQDDKSAVRASQMYAAALAHMNSSDYYNAAYDIGAMAHYVADVGVFGHTMGIATDWDAETHHSDYENEMESMIGSLASVTGIPLGDHDAHSATLALAEDITFGHGSIMSNIRMDTNYNWSNTIFVASAMSSLNGSVAAVAAAINHLMVEALAAPTPPQPSSPPQAPQPPSSLSASLVDSHVVLTWSPPASDGGATITGYTVLRSAGSEDDVISINLPGTSYTWIDESVEKGRTYDYWVLAENSAGLSGKSPLASATIHGDTSSSGLLVAVLTIITVAIASGVAMLWRRKSRGNHPT